MRSDQTLGAAVGGVAVGADDGLVEGASEGNGTLDELGCPRIGNDLAAFRRDLVEPAVYVLAHMIMVGMQLAHHGAVPVQPGDLTLRAPADRAGPVRRR